jgi:diaminopimelate decarboxylase
MSLGGIRGPLDRQIRTVAKRTVARIARRLVPGREDLPLATWRLSRDASGALALGAVRLGDLMARWGSPLHVVDADRLAWNARAFLARPAASRRGCEVFCSYKTSPVPGILRRLHADGLGAEVVSAYELWLALRLGVDPAAIVYNGPARSAEALVAAIDAGVGLINVNSRAELAQLASLARRAGKVPAIGIRVVVPGAVGGQFGERIDTGAALAAFEEALRTPELRVVAVHSHLNGHIGSAEQLDGFLSSILAFAEELHGRLGFSPEVLDLGGNLDCPTVTRMPARARRLAVTLGCEPRLERPRSALSIEDYVAGVVGRIESHFSMRGRPVPRIFVEPGRAMTGNAQMLLCSVVNVRDPDELGIHWAVLDAGVHVAEPLTNEWHQLFSVHPREGAPQRLYRLTGPSCMLSDQPFPAWRLPELRPGAGLAIMDTGAYFVAFSAPFSAPRPAVVMVDNARVQILRSAETFDDLVALDGDWGRCSEAAGTRGKQAPRAARLP